MRDSQILSSIGIPIKPIPPSVFFLWTPVPDEAAGTAPLPRLFPPGGATYPPSLNMLILLIVSNGLSPLGVVGFDMSGTIPSNPPTWLACRRCLVCSCSCAVLLNGEAICGAAPYAEDRRECMAGAVWVGEVDTRSNDLSEEVLLRGLSGPVSLLDPGPAAVPFANAAVGGLKSIGPSRSAVTSGAAYELAPINVSLARLSSSLTSTLVRRFQAGGVTTC